MLFRTQKNFISCLSSALEVNCSSICKELDISTKKSLSFMSPNLFWLSRNFTRITSYIEIWSLRTFSLTRTGTLRSLTSDCPRNKLRTTNLLSHSVVLPSILPPRFSCRRGTERLLTGGVWVPSSMRCSLAYLHSTQRIENSSSMILKILLCNIQNIFLMRAEIS